MLNQYLPSIWLADFHDKQAFDAGFNELMAAHGLFDAIDDRMLQSRHPFAIRAYCAACGEITDMQVSWHYCGPNADGSVHPAWTETAVCSRCGLNSRMRALADFLSSRTDKGKNAKVYIAEFTTPSYRYIWKRYDDVVGSEYLGPNYKPGEFVDGFKGRFSARHEDLTCLSFHDQSLDLVITQDVFEHVPDYRRAFAEIARVLSSQGRLVFTIPFFFDLATTRVRANLLPNGAVEHILPPEIHGNPVSGEGSLCFQNFGWDILPALTAAGFSDAAASMYWGPWQGHLGSPFFVFSAVKP